MLASIGRFSSTSPSRSEAALEHVNRVMSSCSKRPNMFRARTNVDAPLSSALRWRSQMRRHFRLERIVGLNVLKNDKNRVDLMKFWANASLTQRHFPAMRPIGRLE